MGKTLTHCCTLWATAPPGQPRFPAAALPASGCPRPWEWEARGNINHWQLLGFLTAKICVRRHRDGWGNLSSRSFHPPGPRQESSRPDSWLKSLTAAEELGDKAAPISLWSSSGLHYFSLPHKENPSGKMRESMQLQLMLSILAIPGLCTSPCTAMTARTN